MSRELDPTELALANKLAYEWKFIYRALVNFDTENTGLVDIYDFDRACLENRINLTKEELNKLKKHFCQNQEQDPNLTFTSMDAGIENQTKLLKYRELSIVLGLHMDSFDFFGTGAKNYFFTQVNSNINNSNQVTIEKDREASSVRNGKLRGGIIPGNKNQSSRNQKLMDRREQGYNKSSITMHDEQDLVRPLNNGFFPFTQESMKQLQSIDSFGILQNIKRQGKHSGLRGQTSMDHFKSCN